MRIPFSKSAFFHDYPNDTPLTALSSGTFVGFEDEFSHQLSKSAFQHNIIFMPVKFILHKRRKMFEQVFTIFSGFMLPSPHRLIYPSSEFAL